MTLGLTWRTARHLSAEQWLFRAWARGRAALARAAPDLLYARSVYAASRLPAPDIASPALVAAAGPVLTLQRAVWGGSLDDVRRCRFALLGETFDFGAPERVAWRGGFAEGDNPLRRMTLSYMGYAVPLLATGRAEDFTHVAALLRAFEAACPLSAPGVLRDVWNPYAASHRLINLLCGLALHRAAGGAPPREDAAGLLDHARFCAAHVRAWLERDIQYNHLMKNLVALSVYAAALDRVPKPLAFLERALPRSLAQCVLEDGGHAERSPMYHALALLDVETVAACALFGAGWRARLDATLARMRAALAVMTHPDGEIALFNDAWLGETPPARSLSGLALPDSAARLPATGYVRLGEGGDAAIFDCGPLGPDDQPAHGHADFLAVEVSVGGRRFVVDPGTATYTSGPARMATRSAGSHNGPALADAEPAEFWRAFRVGRRGRAKEIVDGSLAGLAPLWCAGRQTGYARLGVDVRRYVGLWPGRGLLICDLWQGRRDHDEVSRFLIPSNWRIEQGVGGAPAFVSGDTRIVLAVPVGVLAAPESARCWPRFGEAGAAHGLGLRPGAAGASRRAALWAAWSDETAPPDAEAVSALFDRLASCAS